MSRCKPLTLSILTFRPLLAVNSSTHVSTVPLLPLPFLYPSRCVTNYRRESLREANEYLPISNDPYTSGPESGGDDPWAFLYRVTPTHRPKVPYLAPSRHMRVQSQPNSTITEREREIFSQIFESILSEKSSFVPQLRESGRSFPSSALTELFESAVGPLANGNEISFGPRGAINRSSTVGLVKASDNKEYPLVLRAAAARAAGLKSCPQTDEGIAAERNRAKEFKCLIDDMKKCENDWKLLQWLDKNLFGMVSSQDAESERKIPSAVYADLLVEGMITFRQSFNDLVGAMSLFERVKGLGAESYVVGCSTGAYNEMLQTKWEAYRDVSRAVELVDEMEVNGIEGDQKTMEILRTIIDEVGEMERGHRGLGAQSIITDIDMMCLDKLKGYAEAIEDRSFEPPERDSLVRDALEYVHG